MGCLLGRGRAVLFDCYHVHALLTGCFYKRLFYRAGGLRR